MNTIAGFHRGSSRVVALVLAALVLLSLGLASAPDTLAQSMSDRTANYLQYRRNAQAASQMHTTSNPSWTNYYHYIYLGRAYWYYNRYMMNPVAAQGAWNYCATLALRQYYGLMAENYRAQAKHALQTYGTQYPAAGYAAYSKLISYYAVWHYRYLGDENTARAAWFYWQREAAKYGAPVEQPPQPLNISPPPSA